MLWEISNVWNYLKKKKIIHFNRLFFFKIYFLKIIFVDLGIP